MNANCKQACMHTFGARLTCASRQRFYSNNMMAGSEAKTLLVRVCIMRLRLFTFQDNRYRKATQPRQTVKVVPCRGSYARLHQHKFTSAHLALLSTPQYTSMTTVYNIRMTGTTTAPPELNLVTADPKNFTTTPLPPKSKRKTERVEQLGAKGRSCS